MKKTAILIITAALCLSLVSGATLSGATAGDPLVTRGYINDKWLKGMVDERKDRLSASLAPKYDELLSRLDTYGKDGLDNLELLTAPESALAQSIYQKMQNLNRLPAVADMSKTIALPSDSTLALSAGTTFVLKSGVATLSGTAVDLSDGVELRSGAPLTAGHLYMAADGGRIASGVDASFALSGVYRLEKTYIASYTQLASALYSLKLFKGSASGFELNRQATREEGLVIMLRLFGEEDAALATTGVHPFTDVPSWAKKYVAYAYEKGYTKGVGNGRFGAGDICGYEQFTTMVMRALGYSEEADGFKWYTSPDFAVGLGVYNSAEIDMAKRAFMRDHAVYFSYYALSAPLKSQSATLADNLVARGVFTPQDYSDAQSKVTQPRVR